jgi:hypothetical protein
MFRCDRCGSGFSPIRVPANELCPRCRARDGVSVTLSFAPFTAATSEVDDEPSSGTEETSRDEEGDQAG